MKKQVLEVLFMARKETGRDSVCRKKTLFKVLAIFVYKFAKELKV